MAKGSNVKRGFLDYFMIFIFIIIAALMITVAYMLFSPFKSVLGFKYVNYNKSEIVNTDTTTNAEINFTTLDDIYVNTSYANVEVIRYAKIDKPSIKISNNVAGFARANQDTSFSYKIDYNSSDKSAIITVSEPKAFWFLNKSISVSIMVPTAYSTSFENTNLNVVTKSGRVYLGNNNKVASGDNYITLKSINVKSNSGRLQLRPYLRGNIQSLFFKSDSASIDSYINLNISNNLNIYSGTGYLNFDKINYSGSDNIILDLKHSKFSAKEMTGDIDIKIQSGYVDIKKLNGNFISNDAVHQMGYATINIKEISGHISLPYASKADIHVGILSSGSQVFINSTSGNITIDELRGDAWLETSSGNVKVHTYSRDISVKTKTGKIDVDYDSSSISNEINLESTSGLINLRLRSGLSCKIAIYNQKGEIRKSSKNINIEFMSGDFVNPLFLNGGNKLIKIVSDGKVNIALIG